MKEEKPVISGGMGQPLTHPNNLSTSAGAQTAQPTPPFTQPAAHHQVQQPNR